MRRRWNSAIAIVLATLAALGVAPEGVRADPKDDPAALAPPETGLYIRIDDLAMIRRQPQEDPIAQIIRSQLPFHRQPAAWEAIQRQMGMDAGQIIDRYFGRSVAIIARSMRGGSAATVVSRVDRADADLAIARLALQPAGKHGDFDVYRTSDGKGYMGFSDRWMLITSSGDGAEWARRVAQRPAGERSLADDEQYLSLTAGAQGSTMIVARDPSTDESHRLSARLEQRTLTLDYRGHNADWMKLLAQLGDARAVEFGPVPAASAPLIATINLVDKASDPKRDAFVDRLLSPRRFEQDVKPKLGSPLVVFSLPSKQADGAPAIGAALRLRDPSAAEDMDRIIDGLILFMNFKTLEKNVEPIARTTQHDGQTTWRTADLGATAAAMNGQPALEHLLKLSYGRIGDWYVVCSQEWAMRQCVASSRAGAGIAAELKALGPWAVERPIVAAVVRPSEAAGAIRRYIAARPALSTGPLATVAERLIHVSNLLEHYESAAVELRADAGEFVVGKLRLTRR